VIQLAPAVLEGHGVRLEPMDLRHTEGIREAAADGDDMMYSILSTEWRGGRRRLETRR
jgi:hypothetical protein